MKRRRRGRRSSAGRRACPLISRRLVPELPQSRMPSGSAGRRRPARRRGSRPSARSSRLALDRRPEAATIPAVERTSAPSPAPVMRLSPGGQRRQHQGAMADRLVAGQPQLAAQAGGSAGRRATARHRAIVGRPCGPAGPLRRPRPRSRPRTCSWTGTMAAIRSRNWSRSSCCSASDSASSGVRVDLDHHAVRPDRDAADRERLDQPALAGGVARVDDDRQVGQLVRAAAPRRGPWCCGCRSRTSGCRARTGSRSGCPELTMYSAAISHSSTVAP